MGLLFALAAIAFCANMAGGFGRLLLSLLLFCLLVAIWPPVILIYLFIIIPLALILG
jgi:hypothetical protein